ncbi:outer membrane beta-barrel protein [Piscinibacter terrae]|uniref:Porin family protein n=1 Tax=Piscinibacter terrae TaxID=2496871 RepID=A0A3N7J674_9BURK|nr:outer membrane beta-barrel protein [Albitalea terrae]RQP26312.1 porin family protein [Albitalea terrae]
MKANILLAALLATASVAAQAAPKDESIGPYAGAEIGRSNFSLSSSLPVTASDRSGNALKIFGGYNFDQNFGAELGYTRFGSFSETATVGAVATKQDGSARSFYGVGTARANLTESFGVHGRAGISFGKVSGTNVLPAANDLTGTKRSLLVGFGADFRVAPNITLTADYDHYGKLSNNVKANTFMVGARVNF